MSELLEGSTLRELLRHGAIPIRKAIDYGVQIAHGLAAAHDKGIVHRDLKPENLFVTKDGRVKILDFGLAKLTQRQPDSDGAAPTLTAGTDPGVVMGTAGYMSPEQVRGQPVDHRTDIFAFGAILYEMLAGKRAFHRSTSAETMTAILNDDPPSISQIVQTAPPGLQRVIHRCLEKNPEQRFHSASDLAFALEALSDSGSAPRCRTSSGLAFTLVMGGGDGLRRDSDRCSDRMVAHSARSSGGGVGHAAHRRWPAEGRMRWSPMDRGFTFNEGPTGSQARASLRRGWTDSTGGNEVCKLPTYLEELRRTVLLCWLQSHRLRVRHGSAYGWFRFRQESRAVSAITRRQQCGYLSGWPHRFRSILRERCEGNDSRTDWFVADKDGLNPHKLVSLPGNVGEVSVSPVGQRILIVQEQPG